MKHSQQMKKKKKFVIMTICTYNHAPLLWDCLEHLKRLDPQPDLYIFLENNSTDNTLDVIKRFDRPKEVIRLWFKDNAVKEMGNPYGVIGTCRQTVLERVRKLNPDYMISIDDDIIIYDKDFIKRITAHHKDIVGAPYLRHYGDGMFLSAKWKRKGYAELWYKSACKGFQPCHVISAGAMCLSRKIIQDKRINFMPIIWDGVFDKGLEGKKIGLRASEDYGYCMKAQAFGYKVWIDCTLRVGHYAEGYSYKPWAVERNEKGEVIGNIDFRFGNEDKISKEILRDR